MRLSSIPGHFVAILRNSNRISSRRFSHFLRTVTKSTRACYLFVLNVRDFVEETDMKPASWKFCNRALVISDRYCSPSPPFHNFL